MSMHKSPSDVALLSAYHRLDEDDLALHELVETENQTTFSSNRGTLCTLSPSTPVFWLVIGLAITAVFGWLGLFMCLDGSCSQATATPRSAVSGVIPQFEFSESLKFEYNSTFTIGDETKVQYAWDQLLSPAHGFVNIEGAAKLGLRPGIKPSGFKGEGYALSVFHQIHCLSAIRKLLASPVANNHDEVLMRNAHIGHCVDYLRQQIMCSADTSLEHARVDGEETEVSGWGVTHQCRDWNQIWLFARDNRLRQGT